MADTLAPGFLLNGRYRIVDLVGAGGMGAVYKAADTHLGGRMVAIKEMSEEGLSPQKVAEATEAFEQEARLLAGLHHPSLPSIHDHFSAGGKWYLVMDFIEGETLEEYLWHNTIPGLPVADVLRIADRVCDVLEYLHQRTPPVIFRDLKPSNIMMSASGHLYLIDFGIARLFKPGQARDTVLAATPGYAAPEQYGKAQTTVRSDIYSFGAMLHELLTGEDPTVKPFTFPPIQPRNRQTPPRLEALVMGMVQMDESRRPPSVTWIRQELHQIASQINTTQPAIPAQPLPPPVQSIPAYSIPPSTTFIAYPNTPVAKRRGPSRIGILAIIGGAIAVFFAVAVICSVAASALGQSPAESTAAAQSQATTDAQSTLSAGQSIWSSDESTLTSDENALGSDVASLEQDANFDSGLASYAQDWKQMQQDYQQEQLDYQQGCSSSGTVQSDAGSVSTDLGSIQSDDGSFAGSVSSFNSDLQQVQTDQGTVQTDLQTLENDAGSNGDASVASSESAANVALANAQQQVTTSNNALQSAQAQAKQYDQEAAQMNTNAQNLANSMQC